MTTTPFDKFLKHEVPGLGELKIELLAYVMNCARERGEDDKKFLEVFAGYSKSWKELSRKEQVEIVRDLKQRYPTMWRINERSLASNITGGFNAFSDYLKVHNGSLNQNEFLRKAYTEGEPDKSAQNLALYSHLFDCTTAES